MIKMGFKWEKKYKNKFKCIVQILYANEGANGILFEFCPISYLSVYFFGECEFDRSHIAIFLFYTPFKWEI